MSVERIIGRLKELGYEACRAGDVIIVRVSERFGNFWEKAEVEVKLENLIGCGEFGCGVKVLALDEEEWDIFKWWCKD
jgi:hypothetical protein